MNFLFCQQVALFSNLGSVYIWNIYNIITGFSPSAGPELRDCTVQIQAKLHICISTDTQNPTMEYTQRSTRQKQYEDFLGTMLRQPTDQSISTARHVLKYWEPQKLCILNSQFPVSRSLSDNQTSSKGRGTPLSCSTLRLKTNLHRNKKKMVGSTYLNHALATSKAALSQILTNTTCKSLHSAQTSPLNVMASTFRSTAHFG